MKTVKLFVEGGGDKNRLHTECRRAFNSFLRKAGLEGHMPRIVACGSRNDAYDSYCTAAENGELAVLLVDSEAPVMLCDDMSDDPRTWRPWYHLKNRKGQDGQLADNWDMPRSSSDEDCHLMVELMEAWFLADIDTLKRYFGQGFNENPLPGQPDIESIAKHDVIDCLKKATLNTRKGTYSKGEHSFKILECINPDKVTSQSRWARRFVLLLSEKMHSNF